MPESSAKELPAPQRPRPGGFRPELPSWLISMVLHVLILLALGLTLRLAPQRGTASERTAEVGIALKHTEGDRDYYQTSSDTGGQDAADSANRANSANLAEFLSDTPPVDPTGALPSALNVIGPQALRGEGVPSAGGMSEGGRQGRGSMGGKGRATLFGITGEGWKFAYVFDRSDSMNWHRQKPLRAAKAELLASLQSLDSNHQFQIIFFNQEPAIFNPSGQRNRLAFATEQNKRNAERFVGGITAFGGTDRAAALRLALSLRPDVIFFLTDADDPMPPGQLNEIRRLAAGVTIHTVEFGVGSDHDPNNFLVKLAVQTGGQHVYKDVSEL